MKFRGMFATSWRRCWRATLLGAMLLLLQGAVQAHPHNHHYPSDSDDITTTIGLVQVQSTFAFTETYDRLIGALSANANIRIIAEFDHTANAESVGLELGNIRLIVFGNPALGTPFMLISQTAGLDLPQKLLVWEADGDVYVGFNSLTYLRARHPGLGRADSYQTVEMALRNLAGAATGVSADSIDASIDNLSYRDFYQIRRTMNRGLYQKVSNADFEITYNRLIAALETAPPSIAFQVDHAANAPNGDLNPTRLVTFANPALGTRLMQAAPSAGIDLPLKILVTQDSTGRVIVSTNRIDFLQYRHELFDDSIAETLSTIRTAITNFVRVAATGA